MAFRYMRFALGAIAGLAFATLTGPTYAKSDQTLTTGDFASVFVISASDELFFNPFADLKVIKEDRRSRAFDEGTGLGVHSYPMKDRTSGAAIRPTAVAGWRSGRVRHLAT